jgi:hypothetical protein
MADKLCPHAAVNSYPGEDSYHPTRRTTVLSKIKRCITHPMARCADLSRLKQEFDDAEVSWRIARKPLLVGMTVDESIGGERNNALVNQEFRRAKSLPTREALHCLPQIEADTQEEPADQTHGVSLQCLISRT